MLWWFCGGLVLCARTLRHCEDGPKEGLEGAERGAVAGA